MHSQEKSFLKEMAQSKGGALWLGEHHNSASDHDLQAEIIRKLYQSRKGKAGTPTMGIGLEQVQVQVRELALSYDLPKIRFSSHFDVTIYATTPQLTTIFVMCFDSVPTSAGRLYCG
jgi:hypothetical protein